MNNKWSHYFSLGSKGALRLANRSVLRYRRQKIGSIFARRARERSAATFIGITGSSAKSTTTALLAHILKGHGGVYRQALYNTFDELIKTARQGKNSIDYVVAEVGVNTKGDMQPMAELLQPDVAIVTLIGVEHYKSFRNKQSVAQEKGALVEAVSPGGIAVLNADDDQVMSMAQRTSERVVTFGREKEADYRVISTVSTLPEPLKVNIVWRGGKLDIVCPLIGEQFWLSVAAASATAIELGVPVDMITRRCASFEVVENRCQPFPTENGPLFIVDGVKAPLESIPLAFSVIENAKAQQKRIVLGQISDYAGDPRPKYRDMYRAARAITDQVIFVGNNSHRSRASEEDRESGRFVESKSIRDVSDHIRNTASKGEVILLKSSQNLHLERVALAWKYDVKCWVDKCGLPIDCIKCGLYEHPFETHHGVAEKNNATINRR